ncbi:hypothetical protein DH2020_018058 [Rehmannia glutinosa]|uniref:PHD-type domain-containing protein n=1 Tax=Rehmannia glutinosa TaxID=99300 RepID=A0ABR0WJS4_REHGL
MEARGIDELQMIEDSVTENHFDLGKPITTKLTPPLSSDVLESWNFMWRFREVLGLKKGFSLEELITELNGSFFDGLSEAHVLMLQVLIREFPKKLKYYRKRIFKYSTESTETELNMPQLNDLTWPEMARRYILAILFMTEDRDSEEVCESMDIFRCLYGDGGPKCGALFRVVGLEVDAQLLAAAVNVIYGSLYVDNDKLAVDDQETEEKNTRQSPMLHEGIPGWVQELEPVKSLKTNVGSRIRTCIHNSLAKVPPAWAREILEQSISKEVYKSNASGPTKKLALHVVAEFHSLQPNLTLSRNKKKCIPISDIVMKHCRIMLRRAAASEKTKRFCNLLRKNLVVSGNNKEGILGSPAVVSSLLYFRTIDMRLATGAYYGSHEAFIEDVREFWRNVLIDFGKFPELVKFSTEASRVFESICIKKVVALYQKLTGYYQTSSAESLKLIENIRVSANEIPRAPWDEGVCRACGIDRDNKKVLLCDECDAEYHTYCLSPPLIRVPVGNWFCPPCVANKGVVQDASLNATSLVCQTQKKKKGEFTNFIFNKTLDLEAMMKGKDYWELNMHERTLLLKFVCNEVLDSAQMREHLTNCESREQSISVDVQSLKDGADSSLRTEFLGVDFGSKLYWTIDFGANHWIIVDGINDSNQCSPTSDELSKNFTSSGIKYLLSPKGSELYSSCACYRSQAEMRSIVDSLKDGDPIKRHLEEWILLHHKPGLDVPTYSQGQGRKELQPSFLKQGENPMVLMTKAIKLLVGKFGPFIKMDTSDLWEKHHKGKMVEGNLFRCVCLEPILRTGHHCHSCHRTYFTTMEYKLHGKGKCNTKSREINIALTGGRTTNSMASKGKEKIDSAIEVDERQSFDRPEGLEQVNKTSPADVASGLEISNFFNVPVSSVRPLMGKALEILTQLKINLLDMEAVVPKDALRPSRACIDMRCAWRLFVKRASTIYEKDPLVFYTQMVQALIVFEDMIKLEYLDPSWRYWSSLSAAASISTLSALSLRIYSLDAAISYEKASCASTSPGLGCNLGPKGKPGRKRERETEETS